MLYFSPFLTYWYTLFLQNLLVYLCPLRKPVVSFSTVLFFPKVIRNTKLSFHESTAYDDTMDTKRVQFFISLKN